MHKSLLYRDRNSRRRKESLADSMDQHRTLLTALLGAVGNGADAERLPRESCCPCRVPRAHLFSRELNKRRAKKNNVETQRLGLNTARFHQLHLKG